MSISQVFNMDNITGMKAMKDNQFDIAVIDPPYGISISSNSFRQKFKSSNWDDDIPSKEFFKELFRVSKNQIIWGGNYFGLPPTQGFLIWDKKQPENFSSSMCEMAWMSFQSPAKIFRCHVVTAEKNKILPTQKPVALYSWILSKYAKPGDSILDTNVGSGSSRIAAYKAGLDFTGYEIDTEYFNAQESRFQLFTSQLSLL